VVLDPLTIPTSIPTTIDRTQEGPPPVVAGNVVVGMVSAGTGNSGVADALGLGAAPPPVARVEPPRAIGRPTISSGVIAGNKLSGATPAYSPIARAARVSGAVVLHAIILKTGNIQSLSVVSGPEMLRANAVAAVQEWKYKPYLLNGEPTEVETTITVNFTFGG
jgi:protein TonB